MTFWTAITALAAIATVVLAAFPSPSPQSEPSAPKTTSRLAGFAVGLTTGSEVHLAVRRAGDVVLTISPQACLVDPRGFNRYAFTCPPFALPPDPKEDDAPIETVLVRLSGVRLDEVRVIALSGRAVVMNLPRNLELTIVAVHCA